MSPRGVPNTLEGWISRLRHLPQYSHLSEQDLVELAKQRMNGETAPLTQTILDLDDLAATDPRLRRKFTKLWKSIFADIEGPPAVRERLAKQTAMAFLIVEKTMVQEWNKKGNVGDGANALNNLTLMVSRYAEQLEQAPKHRKPGKAKDEKVTDLLAAAGRGREIAKQAVELEQKDKELLSDA